MSKSTPWVIHT